MTTSWTYGVRIASAGDGFVASVRDLPEVAITTRSEARVRQLAHAAVDAAVAHRMARGKTLKPPSPVEEGEQLVDLPLQTAVKATLYVAWKESGLSKADVARRMGVNETEVRRILSPRHGSRLGAIEAAARVIGAKLSVDLAAP